MQINRRDMLKLTGLGAVGAAGLSMPFGKEVSGSTMSLLPSSKMPVPYKREFKRQVVATPSTGPDSNTEYYNIYAKTGTAAIANGVNTPILGYTTDPNGPGQVPGPLIKATRGKKVVVTMHNKLPGVHPTFKTKLEISTHLHGSASLPQFDGYANDVTTSGKKKSYHYPNHQPARTLWYHDHGVHFTAQNAYSGLAAQYHLHDQNEQDKLPQGHYDVAVTLSDIAFKADGSQLYDDRSQSGLWGDVILVNGVPWPMMKVEPKIYRFRFLNASISRSYRLKPSLSTLPMHMVATDGGLMPVSQKITEWRHGNAERYEVLIDFRGVAVGQKVYLNNASNPNNRDFDHTGKVMGFEVVADLGAKEAGSKTINPSAFPLELEKSEAMDLDPTKKYLNEPTGQMVTPKVRKVRVERTNGLWALNGQTWDDVMDSGFKSVLSSPDLGDVEIWDIENNSGGWFHPVHIHLVDFQILSRNGSTSQVKAYEKGPKDVVYIGENEKVRVMMRFGDPHGPVKNNGRYMVHCHNLVHEDHDMMHQFSVGLKADWTAGAVSGSVNGPTIYDEDALSDPCVDDND